MEIFTKRISTTIIPMLRLVMCECVRVCACVCVRVCVIWDISYCVCKQHGVEICIWSTMTKITVRVETQTETHTKSQGESPNRMVNTNEIIFHRTDQRTNMSKHYNQK